MLTHVCQFRPLCEQGFYIIRNKCLFVQCAKLAEVCASFIASYYPRKLFIRSIFDCKAGQLSINWDVKVAFYR